MDRLSIQRAARGRAVVLVSPLVLFAAASWPRGGFRGPDQRPDLPLPAADLMMAIEFGLRAGLVGRGRGARPGGGVGRVRPIRASAALGYVTRATHLPGGRRAVRRDGRARAPGGRGERPLLRDGQRPAVHGRHGRLLRALERALDRGLRLVARGAAGPALPGRSCTPTTVSARSPRRSRSSGGTAATASFANRFAVKGGGWRRIEWSSTLDAGARTDLRRGARRDRAPRAGGVAPHGRGALPGVVRELGHRHGHRGADRGARAGRSWRPTSRWPRSWASRARSCSGTSRAWRPSPTPTSCRRCARTCAACSGRVPRAAAPSCASCARTARRAGWT